MTITCEIGDRQGEGTALGNLRIAYADLGEVKKAAALLLQAKAIGERIGYPQIVQVATDTLARLPKPS